MAAADTGKLRLLQKSPSASAGGLFSRLELIYSAIYLKN
jgi:hypothetical protein